MYYLARFQAGHPDIPQGSHGLAWAAEEGNWCFFREGKTWYCNQEDLLLLDLLEEADIRLWQLKDQQYELITDPALCTEVMVEIGMAQQIAEWPTLLVWRNKGGIIEVWGSRFLPAFPDDPVVLLYPDFDQDDPPEADFDEAKEWEDLEGPELPVVEE